MPVTVRLMVLMVTMMVAAMVAALHISRFLLLIISSGILQSVNVTITAHPVAETWA